ncbi:HK97 gp10 family phage protein [Sorangium sp. So ce281]|uniref:HK97 gp10 family phage protein n=1 Tax=unclassified Sorangium TaxID=2621164 RepID=UPI003F646D78
MSDPFEELITEIDRAVEAGLDKAAERGAGFAGLATKGELARSIQAKRTGQFEREISTDKHYAGFVENGRPGFKMKTKVLHFFVNGEEVFARSVGPAKARPFMAPAAKFLDAEGPAIVEQELRQVLR